ncbi:MAG: hypothetical protein NZM44_01560, partial [Candidatus Calescibacterium sp.]|nr:hypothetical protein [Candidatus Calescibacterium sp.]
MKKFIISILILFFFTLNQITLNQVICQEYNLVGVVYKQVENYFYGKVYTLLKKGDILDVYRSNQKVGKVKIEQIDENKNVLLSVVEGQISQGDNLYFVSITEKAEIQIGNTKEYKEQQIKTDLPYEKINDGLKYYSQVLSNNTKIIKFGPNSNRPTKVVLDPTQLFMLYSQYENYRLISEISGVSGVTSAASTFFLFNLLSNLWNTYQNVKGPQMPNNGVPDSFIQIVYLDEKLAKARTILHAHKEAIYDKSYLENYYNNLVSSTNIDDFFIFEITIFNSYNQPLAVSPIAYKVYLIGDDGRRYKAIKYDASLDTTVPPG